MYLLFAGDDYYPQGGAEDLKGGFESVEEAKAAHDPNEHNYEGGWANVLDMSNLKIVMYFNRGTWSEGSPW